ncbi:MAG TPA: DsrE family protein [Terriglobia bacterium]|nr:DsrE family protein [Terriglobia bacterium]
MKAAIVVLADPKTGTEEAFGRVFNALSAACDYKRKGDEVTIVFTGPGTRWSGILTKADHPLNGLYKAVEDKIAGVSCGCADAYGAADDAKANGFALLADNPIPGTTGLPSLSNLTAKGYSILTF